MPAAAVLTDGLTVFASDDRDIGRVYTVRTRAVVEQTLVVHRTSHVGHVYTVRIVYCAVFYIPANTV